MQNELKDLRRVCIVMSDETDVRVGAHVKRVGVARSRFFDALVAGLSDTDISHALTKGLIMVEDRRLAYMNRRREMATMISAIPREELAALAKKFATKK